MKYVFQILIFSTLMDLVHAASLQECLEDGYKHGDQLREVVLPPDCSEIIKAHPDAVSNTGITKSDRVFGYRYILFYDTLRLEGDGRVLIKSRTLHAGKQTEISNVRLLRVFEKERRLLVLNQEKDSFGIMTFNLDIPGSVAPLRHVKSKNFSDTTGFKLLSEQKELAIFSSQTKRIWFINADAHYQHQGHATYTPKILRQFKGEKTRIHHPIDVAASSLKKRFFVLDSGKVLVFDLEEKGNASPLYTFNQAVLFDARSIEYSEVGNTLSVYGASGELLTKLPIN
ncbi:MAG TPA: hypothetical protein VNJ01_10605 [Bacteriovoracaceae bacterium]|nr:hypothetical protein [Bacteriovoracaceae bacterium]